MSVIINELSLKLIIERTGLDADIIHKVFDAFNVIEKQNIDDYMDDYHRLIMEDKPNGKDE